MHVLGLLEDIVYGIINVVRCYVLVVHHHHVLQDLGQIQINLDALQQELDKENKQEQLILLDALQQLDG